MHRYWKFRPKTRKNMSINGKNSARSNFCWQRDKIWSHAIRVHNPYPYSKKTEHTIHAILNSTRYYSHPMAEKTWGNFSFQRDDPSPRSPTSHATAKWAALVPVCMGGCSLGKSNQIPRPKAHGNWNGRPAALTPNEATRLRGQGSKLLRAYPRPRKDGTSNCSLSRSCVWLQFHDIFFERILYAWYIK